MTAATAQADRPFIGVLLIIGFCMLAPLGDGMAKLLGDTIPLGQLLLIRFGIQALLLFPALLGAKRTIRLTRRVMRLTVLRTVLHIVGIGAFFSALRYLPLADALAIAFVMPFIMLLLGRMVLGEEVGPHRLTACAVGFVGTLLVIQPSFAAVGAPALLPLVVALTFSLFMLVTRQVAKDIEPVHQQALSGLVAVVALAPIVLVGWIGDLPMIGVVSFGMTEGLLLAAVGVLGTVAHLLMTWALRFAPSATLAPMQYLEIPFATLVGFLMFGDLPNGLAALGIVVTMAAGFYVVFRERANVEPVPPEA